jgi:hypothetical protein
VTARFLLSGVALAGLFAATQANAETRPNVVPTAPPTSRWREASLDDYRTHLLALTAIVEACAKARDAKTCDPALVGPDDHVPLTQSANSDRRLIRYGWLRVLLSGAREKDKPATDTAAKAVEKLAAKPGLNNPPSDEAVLPPPPTTTQLLQAAETRLTHDLAQTDAAPAMPLAHAQERAVMKQVLAERDFRDVTEQSPTDTALEKFGNWLNRLFESAVKLSSQAPWIGLAIKWGFILAVCIALLWALLQLERRWRVRLVPESDSPALGAASARDWQLWLEDARKAAAAGLWREAIHFVYWASISRLESRRLWPADRARTPREYLALVAAEDPRRPSLATLTGSFERIWYGGRPAAESDYRSAEQLATALISGSAATSLGATGGAAQ